MALSAKAICIKCKELKECLCPDIGEGPICWDCLKDKDKGETDERIKN